MITSNYKRLGKYTVYFSEPRSLPPKIRASITKEEIDNGNLETVS